MVFEWESFPNISSLVYYVNKNNIRREDIQEIIETKYAVILLYWKKK